MGANATTFVPAYVSGEVLTAADLTVTNSGIPVFADSTARDNSFGGTGEKVLAEGQYAYLESTNQTLVYDGANWVSVGVTPGLVVVKAETAFAAASSSVADNVFTSSYTNYRVIIKYQTSTTNNLLMRLRVGGVSSGASSYNWNYIQGNDTTVNGVRLTAQTEWVMGDNTNGAFNSQSIIDFTSPQLAEPTLFSQTNNRSNGAYNTVRTNILQGNNTAATAYDGFELFVSSGTMTGNYTVYGYGKTL
jgi:hypothetical protein